MQNYIVNTIIEVLNKTDDEFIVELNKKIFSNFIKHFGEIKNKKILWIDDEVYRIKNFKLYEYLKLENQLFEFNKKIIPINKTTNKKIKNITYDIVIVPSICFNKNKKIFLHDNVYRKIKKIKYNIIVTLAFGIQMFNYETINQKNSIDGTIISNNFII